MKGCGRAGLLLAALALGGCEDLGLEGKNIPEDLAMRQAPKPLVEQTLTRVAPEPARGMPATPVMLDGAAYIPTPTEYELDAGDVTPVGAAGGATLYALAWDERPYDFVLAFLGGRLYGRLDPLPDWAGSAGFGPGRADAERPAPEGAAH